MIPEEELSAQLSTFSKWISVYKSDVQRGRHLGHQIFTWITQNSKFKTDRCRFGGSSAKGTSTFLEVDIDVVIYVNYEHGDVDNAWEVQAFLENVREDWRDVLMMCTELAEEDLLGGKIALKFELDGFHFDLCGMAVL